MGIRTLATRTVKIAVFGCGYVGLANACLLASEYDVVVYDIDRDKIDALENRICPFRDPELEDLISQTGFQIMATTDPMVALQGADYVIICTPTDFDSVSMLLNTSSIVTTLRLIQDAATDAVAVIRSTVPIGFCDEMAEQFPDLQIVFAPEFLREGSALQDSLHPSRIIVSPVTPAPMVFSTS